MTFKLGEQNGGTSEELAQSTWVARPQKRGDGGRVERGAESASWFKPPSFVSRIAGGLHFEVGLTCAWVAEGLNPPLEEGI